MNSNLMKMEYEKSKIKDNLNFLVEWKTMSIFRWTDNKLHFVKWQAGIAKPGFYWAWHSSAQACFFVIAKLSPSSCFSSDESIFSPNEAILSTFRLFHFLPKKLKLWSLCLPCTFENSGHYTRLLHFPSSCTVLSICKWIPSPAFSILAMAASVSGLGSSFFILISNAS